MSFGLKIGHFQRGVALFTCMKQQSVSLLIAFIFISNCDACLECLELATDYPYTIAMKIIVLPFRTAR